MSSLDTVKAVLKSLLVSSPQDLTYHRLNRDYKDREGQDIPFSKLGYRTLPAFLLSLPDTLTLNAHTGVVTPVVLQDSKNAHVQKLVKEQRPSKNNRRDQCNSNMSVRRQTSTPQTWGTIPPLMSIQPNYHPPNYSQQNFNQQNFNMNLSMIQMRQKSIGTLLQPPSMPTNIAVMNMMYNQSVHAAHTAHLTPNAYMNHTFTPAESINRTIHRSNGPTNGLSGSNRSNGHTKPNNSSNQNKTEIVSNPPNRNVTTTDQQNGFEKVNVLTDSTSENDVKEVAALPDFDDYDPIHLIGTGYLGSNQIGKSIPSAVMPVNLKNGDIHQISIKEITSMWHFFFQFFDSQDDLDYILGELRDSCVTTSLNLIVRKSELQTGDACAAFFCEKWLRAEVLGDSGDDLVKVLFVDFGTIANVAIQNIRWLLKKFCDMPRLYHRGALTFLEPITNYKIEKTVTRTFCKMVREKSMMAVISSIDENNTIFMTLIDTSQQEDVIINKILLDSLSTANKKK